MVYLTILGEQFWFAVLGLNRLPRVITFDTFLNLVSIIPQVSPRHPNFFTLKVSAVINA